MTDNNLPTPPARRLQGCDDSKASQATASDHTNRSPTLSTSSSTLNSVGSLSSPSPWRPSSRSPIQIHQYKKPVYQLHCRRSTRWAIAFACLAIVTCLWCFPYPNISRDSLRAQQADRRQILLPSSSPNQNRKTKKLNPQEWLIKNSDDRLRDPIAVEYPGRFSSRPKAALISLVRNEELDGILQSMRQLEYHWNSRYRYPWMFFSEKPFSEDFKAATTNATSANTSYHLIPRAHWSTPSWVNPSRHHDSLTYLHNIGVGKGHMLSYRHMCRWNSGFFYHHPALAEYEYYWRVEPDVHFFCNIEYDPFRFLHDNGLVYGFNMNILDDARSFASLWRYTKRFAEEFPDLIHPDADLEWLIDEENGGEYNNCQFFSNFEIGSLNFFRGEGNTKYFEFWDETAGGFFYERYGDAPIHTLSVALFAPKDKVWFFRDIGYQHDIARHCPADGVARGRCTCEPTGLDENFYKLVPMESPQRKPADTCVRLWLGSDWLEKKEGWDQETERLLGGDGYQGYLKNTL